MNVGRTLNKLFAVIVYLALVWTVREMIHEAYDPARQSSSMVTYP